MTGSYSTIPELPRAGQEIDALELAAKLAETARIPKPLAQKISQGLDALDGKADGLVAVDRYSDHREGRINGVIRSGLESHGIFHTTTFLSVSHFTNVLLNDTRDPVGLIHGEQLKDQIAINLDKLGLAYDAALPQALAEVVQASEGRSDGLISVRSGERGDGRGNATLGQIEAMLQSESSDLLGSSIAAALASALNPTEDFIPPQNVPPAPGREGEVPSPSLNEDAVSFLLEDPSGRRSMQASGAGLDPSLFFIPEFTGINQGLIAVAQATKDSGLLSSLSTISLSTGDPGSKIRYVSLDRLRLDSRVRGEVQAILEWLTRVSNNLKTQNGSLTSSEETELKGIIERLDKIRPALMKAVAQYRSSFPPQKAVEVAASTAHAWNTGVSRVVQSSYRLGPQRASTEISSTAHVWEVEAARAGQFSQRLGPYGRPLLLAAVAVLVIGGVIYGARSLAQGDEQGEEKK
jgi:hypothetical protein